jgi:hypothetical protein
LKESKETLEKQQLSYSQQLEVVQGKAVADRKELTEKVDLLNAEIAKRERLCTNLENQKESLQLAVQKSDKNN